MMKFIVWQKKWETGIKKIDEQHMHFVGIINKVYALNEEGKEKESLKIILNDLTEYARIHFSTEEEYFEETNYPDAEMHMEKHEKLLKKVIEFDNKFENKSANSEIIQGLMVFLRDWLDNHLVEVDHEYVPWLTEHDIR